MSVKVHTGVSGIKIFENGNQISVTKDGELIVTKGHLNAPAIAIYARGHWQNASVVNEEQTS